MDTIFVLNLSRNLIFKYGNICGWNVQVVNGFFCKGSPVHALDQGPDHSTALGVSVLSF
jgi:hypothetical protein